jgi:hypothetical protein
MFHRLRSLVELSAFQGDRRVIYRPLLNFGSCDHPPLTATQTATSGNSATAGDKVFASSL